MKENAIRIGGKIRKLRRDTGLSQAKLAERLGVSASYLNLIEHNKRRLSAPILLKLAAEFDLDARALAEDGSTSLLADVMDVLSDDLFEDLDIATSDARALVEASPTAARAMLHLHGAYRKTQSDLRTIATSPREEDMGDGFSFSRLAPAEAVSEFIQEKNNYFEDLEVEAERIGYEIGSLANRSGANVSGQNGSGEARSLEAISEYLRKHHRVETVVVSAHDALIKAEISDGGMQGPSQNNLARATPFQRRFDPEARILYLSERLSRRSRLFQSAYQTGLIAARPVIEMLLNEGRLRDEDARVLGRSALANYFAAALLMPYDRFLASVEEARYDIDLLRHRFGQGFEQICHRLTTLNKRGASGAPLHMLRVDAAGNISKRFSLSGLPIPRHGEACARWNVYAAFQRPGEILAQISELPDGSRYFCIARTVKKSSGGFGAGEHTLAIGLGCEEKYASKMIYSDAVTLGQTARVSYIGVNCRICDRLDCAQRAQAPLHMRGPLDENLKGLSPYTSSAAHGRTQFPGTR